MFSIIISEKGGAERREAFDRTEIKVGRVQGNDLMLPKGNVSKRHARLLYRDGRFIVTDLKSTNGTYVNGRKIAQATIVREGDKIYIGDFVLRIEMAGASQPGVAPPQAPNGPQAEPSVDESGEPSGQSLNQGSGQFEGGASGPTAMPGPPAMSSAPPMPAVPPAPPAPVMQPAMQPPMGQPQPTAPGPHGPPQMPMGQAGARPSQIPAPVGAPMNPPTPPLVSQAPMPQPVPVGNPGGAFPPQPPVPQAGGPVSAGSASAQPSNFPPQPPRYGAPPQPSTSQPPMQPASMQVQPIAGVTPQSSPIPSVIPSAGAQSAPVISTPPPPVSSSGSPLSVPPGAQPPSTPQSHSVPPQTPQRRVDKPVEPSQVAEHRAILGKLMQRVLGAIDLAPLANGNVPEPNAVAAIERALRDQANALRAEVPAGLDLEVLVAEARRELFELGPIGPLLEDEDVEEVQVIRHDHIVALHGRRQVATEIAFSSEEAVARVVRRVCQRAGRPLGHGEVFLERRLERGGRLFGVLPPASGEGHMLVFRKPQRALLTLEDLVRSGTISRAIATLLTQCVAGRANVLVTGAVSSGATSLLGALAGSGSIDDRVIVLQEDDELVFNQPHTVSILLGDTAEEGARAVRTAIRVRPDRLVVGAFAGHVVAEVVDAVGDGVDGVLASARAPTIRQLIQRCPADLAATRGLASVDVAREWLAAAFDIIIEVARLRDGRHRVMRVAELVFNGEGGTRELGARDIFTFSVERTAAGGTVEGSFHPTGHVPRIMEDMNARGANVDLSIFNRPSR